MVLEIFASFIGGLFVGLLIGAYKLGYKKRDDELLPLASEAVESLCSCDGRGTCAACKLWIRMKYHE